MSRRHVLRLAALLLLGVVTAACAPLPTRGDRVMLAAQAAREAALATQSDWGLEGKLGVSDGRDGGSANLDWTQRGAVGDFVLRTPVTGRSFSLHIDADGAVLDGLDGGPRHGPDGAALLQRAFGWDVPLTKLGAWVRGLRAPDTPATLSFGVDGLPARLVQDGWTIDYRDWFADETPAMPRKVFATRGADRVRLAIRRWSRP